MPRGTIQARALTGWAGATAQQLGQLIAHQIGISLTVAAFQIGQHPFKGMTARLAFTTAVGIGEFNHVLAATVQNQIANARRQLLKRHLQGKTVMPRQPLQQRKIIKTVPIPAAHRTARQTQMRMRHHPFGIEKLLNPQPVAFRARPNRVIEREQARLQFAETVTAHRAGITG